MAYCAHMHMHERQEGLRLQQVCKTIKALAGLSTIYHQVRPGISPLSALPASMPYMYCVLYVYRYNTCTYPFSLAVCG